MPRLLEATAAGHPAAWRLLPEHLERALPAGVHLPAEYRFAEVGHQRAGAEPDRAAAAGAEPPRTCSAQRLAQRLCAAPQSGPMTPVAENRPTPSPSGPTPGAALQGTSKPRRPMTHLLPEMVDGADSSDGAWMVGPSGWAAAVLAESVWAATDELRDETARQRPAVRCIHPPLLGPPPCQTFDGAWLAGRSPRRAAILIQALARGWLLRLRLRQFAAEQRASLSLRAGPAPSALTVEQLQQAPAGRGVGQDQERRRQVLLLGKLAAIWVSEV